MGDEGYANGSRSPSWVQLGVAFLCSDLGIAPEVRVDRTAYIASWFTVLNTTSASSSPPPSQRAADYLHSLQAVNADAATRRGFYEATCVHV